MGQAKHQDCVLVLIQWEVLAIIDSAELHTVVVDHTIRGDGAVTVADQQQCSFIPVHILQFFTGGGAAVHIQIMAAADFLQIREVGDHRCLLAAECQVDQMPHIEKAEPDSGRLEFCLFLRVKAVQPLGEVIHLIQIDCHLLQPLENRPVSTDLIHPAVSLQRISQTHALEHIDHAGIVLLPDWERNGGLPIFWSVCVADDGLYHSFSS